MKQAFLKFPNQPKSYRLPKMVSRRFPGAHLEGSAAYLTDAEAAAQAKTELLNEIKAQTEQEFQKRGFVNKSEMETAVDDKLKNFKDLPLEALRAYATEKKALEDKLAAQEKIIAEQGLALTGLKEASQNQNRFPDRKTIADQIRAFRDKPENKSKWEAFKNRETNSFGSQNGDAIIELDAKHAAITMTMGASIGTPGLMIPAPEVLPGVVDLARNRPFLENYANVGTTNSPRIVWTEKYNPQGNADFIGEGVVKPLISFEIRSQDSYAKKVADKIKVSTEMLEDVDFIAGEIENELRYKVDIAVDDGLLNGAGDGTVSATDLKGLDAYVGGYVLTTVLTTSPNNFDAIRAVIAQIVSLNFNPNALFLNPIDAANMDLVKDKNDRPLALEYRAADGRIFRLQPIESNQMPVGEFLIGDMTRFRIRNYRPFSVAYGWVNDDFEKNLVTIIGERRLHAFVAANDVGAFVLDTWANVKTAIDSGV